MPVFNESRVIEGVLRSWARVLDDLPIRYELRIYDDGSTDRTLESLRALEEELPALNVTSHENCGHGPTVIRGYQEAEGDWVFQVDSDGEIPATDFGLLWGRREGSDLVLGYRRLRESSAVRGFISRIARGTIGILFRSHLRDVNCPYRLFRRTALAPLISWLPTGTFAPNVALSGLAVRFGLRIIEVPVNYCGRRHGSTPSLSGWKALKPAALSFLQTAAIAFRARRAGRNGR